MTYQKWNRLGLIVDGIDFGNCPKFGEEHHCALLSLSWGGVVGGGLMKLWRFVSLYILNIARADPKFGREQRSATASIKMTSGSILGGAHSQR